MSPPSITTAVTVAELAGIRPLVQHHIDYEGGATTVPADWAERAARFVAVGRLVVFVARVGGEAVGYASVTTDVATWTGEAYAHLDCVFVAEGHRGSGTGRLLLDASINNARRGGHRQLQWQTPGWNAGAIRFYERFGASHESKERFTLVLPTPNDIPV